MRNVRIAVCLMVGVLAFGSTADAATIVGWGRDDYGQATPPSGNDYTAIASGAYHSLALEAGAPEPVPEPTSFAVWGLIVVCLSSVYRRRCRS